MRNLSKTDRKRAYTYVRERINAGKNKINVEKHEGLYGICELLDQWVESKFPHFNYIDPPLYLFPEFQEEEPVVKFGYFWWEEHDDASRIDAMTRCIAKL